MFIFGLFKQAIHYLQQIVKKCPSSIQCWDLNPQPFEHELSPVTTRPGVPPYLINLLPFTEFVQVLCADGKTKGAKKKKKHRQKDSSGDNQTVVIVEDDKDASTSDKRSKAVAPSLQGTTLTSTSAAASSSGVALKPGKVLIEISTYFLR